MRTYERHGSGVGDLQVMFEVLQKPGRRSEVIAVRGVTQDIDGHDRHRVGDGVVDFKETIRPREQAFRLGVEGVEGKRKELRWG